MYVVVRSFIEGFFVDIIILINVGNFEAVSYDFLLNNQNKISIKFE